MYLLSPFLLLFDPSGEDGRWIVEPQLSQFSLLYFTSRGRKLMSTVLIRHTVLFQGDRVTFNDIINNHFISIRTFCCVPVKFVLNLIGQSWGTYRLPEHMKQIWIIFIMFWVFYLTFLHLWYSGQKRKINGWDHSKCTKIVLRHIQSYLQMRWTV